MVKNYANIIDRMSSTSLLLPYLDGQYREEEEETERKANLVSSAVSFFPFFSFRKKNKTIRFAEEFETRQLAAGKKALKMKFDPTAIFKRTAVATCAKIEEGGERKNSRGGLSLKVLCAVHRGEHSK